MAPDQNSPGSKQPRVKTAPGQNSPGSKQPQVKTAPGQNSLSFADVFAMYQFLNTLFR